MFRNVENSTIPEIESKILEFWKKNKIFEKSVDERSKDNLFVFYDGPPFISGLPHYGHLLGSIAKDVIPRYWTMKGKKVERVWGWDAHGLTVENRVQANLGIKKRRDIEKFGLEEFTKECYKYTSETSAEWEWYVDKIGRWVDMEKAYKTTDQDYMESVIWAFKKLYEKNYIFEGIYTSLYCTTCGTPVSNFEIAMDNTYMDYEDHSITVKFEVTTKGKFDKAYLLAWTTTPWTLPSNRALVVDENEQYVLLEQNNEKFILAEKRTDDIFKDKKFKIIEKFDGKKLLGLSYKPLYTFYAYKDSEFKVYSFENMVTMEEGTGIVHSAPGFGDIDGDMGKHYNLTTMLTLDDEGRFISGNNGKNLYEGQFYIDANIPIKDELTQRGLVFDYGKKSHRVPYHDRCQTFLIQRAQNSWFVDIQKLKNNLIKNNESINWVPEHLKNGRFKIGIAQAPNWCISRARFWATPMPVWRSDDGDTIVAGSVKEIEQLSGQKVENLHRPFIDKIIFKKNNKVYKRIPEVLDSWFEAGSMPYAQIHYPFENEKKFEKNFPGDYIVEYISQTRAWFFFMHVLSTALFGTNSFKNVITTGVMSGTDGRKMSKTYNNYTDPKQVLETIGGDSVRLYLMTSPLMVGENANFDEQELRNKLKNVLNPLWNTLKFFIIYASLHKFSPKKFDTNKLANVLDIWIVTRLHETIRDISTNLENYVIPDAASPIEIFVDDLSRWYTRRSRDRISSGDSAALSTLFYVLLNFAKAASPIIPFITEEIFQDLKNGIKDAMQSVHLELYPDYDEKFIKKNQEMIENMKKTREIVSLALAIRVNNKIGVRQPLGELFLNSDYKLESKYLDIVKDEINVKNVSYTKDTKDVDLDLNLTDDLKKEGVSREMIRKFQDLRKQNNLKVNDKIKAVYRAGDDYDKVVTSFKKEIMDKIYAVSLEAGDDFVIEKI